RDRVLAFLAKDPVDERLAFLDLDVAVLLWIDEYDAVLVEQVLVALVHDLEIAAVLEADPRAAIRQRIGAHADGGVERGAHARAGLAVPLSACRLYVDARVLPLRLLLHVGAEVIAAGGARRLGGGDLLHRVCAVRG